MMEVMEAVATTTITEHEAGKIRSPTSSSGMASRTPSVP
jgi:hypothetical protein